MPVLRELDGYQGYVLLGDRESGGAIAVTYWDSEDAMKSSEDAVKAERQRAAEAAEARDEPSVERYEVLAQS